MNFPLTFFTILILASLIMTTASVIILTVLFTRDLKKRKVW